MHGHLRQGRTYRSKITLRRRKLDLFAQINWQVDRMGIVGPAATLSLARNHEWPGRSVADLGATVAWMTQTLSFLPALSRASLVFSPPLSTRGIPPPLSSLLTVCSPPNHFSTRLPITSRVLSVQFPSINNTHARVPSTEMSTIIESITEQYYN